MGCFSESQDTIQPLPTPWNLATPFCLTGTHVACCHDKLSGNTEGPGNNGTRLLGLSHEMGPSWSLNALSHSACTESYQFLSVPKMQAGQLLACD